MKKNLRSFSCAALPVWIAIALFAAVPAWGSITIDARVSTDQSSAKTTVSSPAFSTTAGNELLLAFVSADNSASPNTTVTNMAGGGLTWALVERTNVQLGTAEIWRAFAPTTLSGVTVTATLSQSVVSSITVMSFAGVDTSGTSGSGAIGAIATGNANPGAPTATLVTTRGGSLVLGVGNDWDNAINRTVGPNQTLIHQYEPPVGDTYWVQMQTNPIALSGTSVAINDTAPSSDRYDLSAVEVLAASGGVSTFTVSGSIGGGGGASVTLAQSGTTVATATANSSGSYSFSGIANGTYTVTPSLAGFTISPANQTVTVNGSNVIVPSFTATAITFTVSGSITGGGGASVTLAQSGTTVATATANSSGSYSFSGIANGTYTVTPSLAGFTIGPANQTVTVNGSNVTVPNFTATATTFTVSGSITGGGGASVTLAQSGTTVATATANSSGSYSFQGIANGTYTVTPSLTGFTISPASQTITVSGSDMAMPNFTATAITFTVSGSITGGGGATVTLSQSGTTVATATANSSGSYSFTGIANGTYTVTPSLTGFPISPASQTVTVNGANITVPNFTASGGLIHVGGAAGAPVVNNQVMTFNYTPAAANDAVVILVGCRSPGITGMSLTASGWTLTPISGLVGPSGFFDFISTFGAIVPNTSPVTFTVTLTGGNGDCTSNDTTFLIDEFSGNDTTGGTTTFDAHNESLDPLSSGICTGAPVTPANNNDALWYACFDNVTDVSGGYTKGQDDGTGDWTEYTILSGSLGVPQNPGFVTNPNFFTFGLGGVSIKPAAPASSVPDVTIATTHQGNFTQGQTGATYSITVTNNGGAPTSGKVTMTDVLPAGLTATAITGTNWSCTLASLTCTRSDVLGAGASYPAILLTVSVAINAPASITNTATVSGGGETNTANDRANDVTNIVPLTFSISGVITGGAGSTVTLAQGSATIATVTADSSGNYSFAGLANGAYTATPSQTGFTFTPANQAVTMNGASATGINFTATANQPGAIKLVQANVNGSESSGSSISVAFNTANVQGNFLIVTGTAARSATTLTISDTLGNTYLPATGPVTDTNQDVTAYIWYVPSCKGGSNAVTLTPAAAAALEIHVSEWSGLATTSALDQTASATGTGTAASSGTATTGVNGELVFGYTFLLNTAAAGTGFTGLTLVNGDMDEYEIQSAAGPVAATFAQTSGTWFALMATFRPAGGGGPPTTFNIKGTVTPVSGGSGATLALSGASTASATADASGNYTFSGLSSGTYTVTPSKTGFTFSPSSQQVTITGADATGVNFTAQSTGAGTLAIDVRTANDSTAASSSVHTSAFSTTAPNELLLAFVATDYISGANTTVTGVSGGGLTWGLVVRTNTQMGTAEIWRAFSPSALSNVTVTATLSQSVLASITVMSFTGADATGTGGSGAIGATASANAGSGAPSGTLLTTRSNSWVFGVGNDFDNAISRTPGAGQSLVHQDLASTGDTYWVQMQNSTTPVSGTSVSINDTAPTADRYNLSLVEVLPALAGGGGGAPPSVNMSAPAPSAVVTGQTTVAANASDQTGISSVQFILDANNLGAPVTSAPYSITWDTTTATAGSHTLSAVARDSSGLSTTSAPITVTVDNSGNPAVVGSWSSPVTIPTVAVNLILTGNNKLLFYDDGASPTLWDYINNTFSNISTNANLFCSGHAMLSDGRILVVGGFGGTGTQMGIANAEIFDPVAKSWSNVPKMAFSRWYPTATTLSDGRVLVTAGWQTTQHTNAGIPEIYDPGTNSWTQLTGADNPFETYPFMFLLPDGRVLHAGGTEFATATDFLNVSTQTWTMMDARVIDGASATMYRPGMILKAGSASDSQGSGPSSNTTFVLDATQPSPAWQQTPSMAYPRSFMNLTTLPDGSVLATGGETDKNGGNISNAVYAAELWSPQTQTWTTMASMHTPREYHSTALLLPDGRVVQSGMGADFGNVPNEMSAEFYSPPYLFKGARPAITQAPAQVHYGQSFTVSTADGATVAKAVLIRTGAVTHFFDQNTRYVPVTFSQVTGGLSLTAPVNGNSAPPGYYMLFLINGNGVPSVASIVQVGP